MPAEWAWPSPLPPPPSELLAGKSPEELYLSLGLGFAFMRLGAAETRRILRAAKAAAAEAGGEAADPLLPDWLPEGRHSQLLSSLGRGVTAAWGAGRVYIYAPEPLDRFMQTTELRAGLFDAALRPPDAEPSAAWSAWPGACQALAAAAAGNASLREALREDAAFPSEMMAGAEEDWEAGDGGADEDDFFSDDALFSQPQPVPDVPVNFAPGGLRLPKAKLLQQPWRAEGFKDEAFERLRAERLAEEEPGLQRPWPKLPDLEELGIFLTDERYGILSLHSCDLFVLVAEGGLLDLRHAWGVDKEGDLDGMSENWWYTDRVWFASEEVPPDTPLADYRLVHYTRRPTLPGTRGDRQRGEQTFLVDWAEEHKRIYLVRSNCTDYSVPVELRTMDLQTVFVAEDVSGKIKQVPVQGLLREGEDGELEETWDLPHDADLVFESDKVFIATPDQLETPEDMAYNWLLRNRWKLQPDGSMTGTPLRLQLTPEFSAQLAAEKAEQDKQTYFSPAQLQDLEARRAAEEADRLALEQEERETLDDSSDAPEVDGQF